MTTTDALHPPKPIAPAAILRELWQFLKRPEVLKPTGLRAPGALPAILGIIGLYLGVQLLLMLPFLKYWQSAFELPSPDAFGKIDPKLLPWLVVIVAPFLEELIFRGWQTGTRRALGMLVCMIVVGLALTYVQQGLSTVIAGSLVLGGAVAALVGWFTLGKRREPLGWFAKFYPAIFYLVVAVFALSHLSNYDTFTLLAVPMVLPQAWGALLLGFARQRIGLTGSILAHAVVNGVVLGVAQLGY